MKPAGPSEPGQNELSTAAGRHTSCSFHSPGRFHVHRGQPLSSSGSSTARQLVGSASMAAYSSSSCFLNSSPSSSRRTSFRRRMTRRWWNCTVSTGGGGEDGGCCAPSCADSGLGSGWPPLHRSCRRQRLFSFLPMGDSPPRSRAGGSPSPSSSSSRVSPLPSGEPSLRRSSRAHQDAIAFSWALRHLSHSPQFLQAARGGAHNPAPGRRGERGRGPNSTSHSSAAEGGGSSCSVGTGRNSASPSSRAMRATRAPHRARAGGSAAAARRKASTLTGETWGSRGRGG